MPSSRRQTPFHSRAIRLSLLVCLLLAVGGAGCAKKRRAGEQSLHAIPSRYVSGDFYLNKRKGYKLPIPGALWEYIPDNSFDLAFHARDYPAMLLIEGYTDYLSVPNYKKVAERFARKVHGRNVQVLEPPSEVTEGVPYLTDLGQQVQEGKSLVRFSLTLRPQKRTNKTVERVTELYVARGRRRLLVIGLMSTEDTIAENRAALQKLIDETILDL